jgi:CyaY protein
MDEAEYSTLAGAELSALLAALDALSDAKCGQEGDSELEAELASDILTIEFADDSKFVINSHRAARQIWMAAGTSAWHFDFADGRWVAAKSGDELWRALSGQLSRALDRPIDLRRTE